MKVALKYRINQIFKFVIIKTQLITCYYHLILREALNLYLNLHLHLQEIQTTIPVAYEIKIIGLPQVTTDKSNTSLGEKLHMVHEEIYVLLFILLTPSLSEMPSSVNR